jgi:hypothetical protein
MVLPFIRFHLFTGLADQAEQTMCIKKKERKEKKQNANWVEGMLLNIDQFPMPPVVL